MLVKPAQGRAKNKAENRQSTGSLTTRGPPSSSPKLSSSSSPSLPRSDRAGRGTATGKVGKVDGCWSLKMSLTPSRW
jgi:hypothetical protein